jgi:hypothetical protein
VRSTRSSTSSSSSFRFRVKARCLGPEVSEAMKGRLISVSSEVDSSCRARSACSLSRCCAMRSLSRPQKDQESNKRITGRSRLDIAKLGRPRSISDFFSNSDNRQIQSIFYH